MLSYVHYYVRCSFCGLPDVVQPTPLLGAMSSAVELGCSDPCIRESDTRTVAAPLVTASAMTTAMTLADTPPIANTQNKHINLKPCQAKAVYRQSAPGQLPLHRHYLSRQSATLFVNGHMGK
jgi:hypothetical protein